jgi:hypothetical protein
MLAVRRATDDPDTQMALGWRVTTEGQRRIVWSNGRADGYRAYLAFDPDTRVGVVALANAATNAGVDDIAQHILNPRFQPLKAHPRIQLAAEVIDRYVGRYRFDDGVVMTITRDGQRVISDITDQGQIELFAAAEREFYPEGIEAQILFDEPVDGRSRAMILNQDGQTWRAVRLD